MNSEAASVREILTAPGPVLVASTNPDVWAKTAHRRAEIGPIFLFDLQHVSGLPRQPQAWWLDPLATVHSVGAAARLTSHFMRGLDDPGLANAAVAQAAARTLRNYLLAAGCGRKSLRDVLVWIATRSEEPAALLEASGYSAQAASLRCVLSNPMRSPEAVFSIVSSAIACLQNESVLRRFSSPSTWVGAPTAVDTLVEVNLWSLVTGPAKAHPTIYLLYRGGKDSVRPVVTAIVGELVHLAVQAASARGGCLKPPLTISSDARGNAKPQPPSDEDQLDGRPGGII